MGAQISVVHLLYNTILLRFIPLGINGFQVVGQVKAQASSQVPVVLNARKLFIPRSH
jgi:hypothetical protein